MKNEKTFLTNILIAEDNPANYSLLKEMLQFDSLGHFWAKNGIEAITMLDQHKSISLILMDINMPKMDGITATLRIREKGIDLPIIFQTAYTTDEDMKKCFRAGGNEFLCKPIIREMLFMILQKYLPGVNLQPA